MIHAVSYMARTVKIDRIVALDEFDMERAAELREHMRNSRHGRDHPALLSRQAGHSANAPTKPESWCRPSVLF